MPLMPWATTRSTMVGTKGCDLARLACTVGRANSSYWIPSAHQSTDSTHPLLDYSTGCVGLGGGKPLPLPAPSSPSKDSFGLQRATLTNKRAGKLEFDERQGCNFKEARPDPSTGQKTGPTVIPHASSS
ncbi:hypothetical protein HAX54_044779 [Datura stramonium]|uniref:Uncharacterized protein n=1 Tax=Datura stramonium TaxID=4076 RepID=A0ABS8SPU9_DATST|nr:hypothetical protein [Datura stramonium]